MTDDEILAEAQRGWKSGLGDGTPCGGGSTMWATEAVREWLPDVVAKYGIRRVCDAGAGDLHWIQHVKWDVQYRGFDLVPRHEYVEQFDITKDDLPQCDLILCRMVLNHLGQERTDAVIERFRRSGKYLLANRYVNTEPQHERPFRQVRIRLGKPLAQIRDGYEDGCYLALWEL